ncbi:MAG: efflux RND transporter permease subunit [Halieaceae bacterium]|jgi:multidrug efflux pump subunit AcrB|nr:efflux RND transporter permease subunit [Halieaceae bacterium]
MQGFFQAMMRTVLVGNVPKLLFLLGLIAGLLALKFTPREEEPQIVVPMVDVVVSTPGLSAQQTEREVTIPLERLLSEIPGIEHIYSTSTPGGLSVTLRFHVGEDREEALLNTYNKLYANTGRIPPVVEHWQVHPIEVDDVPILLLGLWSKDPQYSDHDLRRIAGEFATALQTVDSASKVDVVGGRPRRVTLYLDAEAMSARRTSASDIVDAFRASSLILSAGRWVVDDQAMVLEAGDVLRTADELRELIVNVVDGAPVYLQDVARIEDGPAEAESYTWIRFVDDSGLSQSYPMVAVSVAKESGTNAVAVAADTLTMMEEIRDRLLPPGVDVAVLRDYGQTADDKVNNLTSSLVFAIVTVVVFIALFLGWRSGVVVGLAVPVCYGIAFAFDYLLGYTINRVTLFALILSLGLLVDDPITGVDNIARFLDRRGKRVADRVIDAMAEITGPLIMSTITIVLAFIPLAYITGMMGPYMAPMAFNVPLAVIASTVTAFLLTPWLAFKLLGHVNEARDEQASEHKHFYVRMLGPLLATRRRARWTLLAVVLLFLAVCLLPAFRAVPLKLLPFDNRTEVQVLVDMPEGTSLERTAAVTQEVSQRLGRLPEVATMAAFVGEPSPIDFNGMVRRYYARQAPHLGELRVVLLPKEAREQQSHAVVLRMRELLAPMQADGVSIKVVEVPPGPPVLSTIVAEIYADLITPYETQRQAAREVVARLESEPHVVEVDSTLEAPHARLRFITDKQKAALSGISTHDIAQTLRMSNAGYIAGYLQAERELEPLAVELRLPMAHRATESDLKRLIVRGRAGITKTLTDQGLEAAAQPQVPLGELGEFARQEVEPAIHRKDLRRVVYVTAELNGRTPAEVIADVAADRDREEDGAVAWSDRTYFANGGGASWSLPEGTEVTWAGEGELLITLDVFRDMGLGYLFALIAIFVVLRLQTRSVSLSLIIMSAIPLTVIGILPGFWLMNQIGTREIAGAPEPVLFTATAMIGMIALAGIVVRNSLILVEFIQQEIRDGRDIKDAVLAAGAVRMRPVLLTAGTTMLGNLVITLDPVFNGLALAIIFGIIASTIFSLVVVPVVYWLVYSTHPEDALSDPEAALADQGEPL